VYCIAGHSGCQAWSLATDGRARAAAGQIARQLGLARRRIRGWQVGGVPAECFMWEAAVTAACTLRPLTVYSLPRVADTHARASTAQHATPCGASLLHAPGHIPARAHHTECAPAHACCKLLCSTCSTSYGSATDATTSSHTPLARTRCRRTSEREQSNSGRCLRPGQSTHIARRRRQPDSQADTRHTWQQRRTHPELSTQRLTQSIQTPGGGGGESKAAAPPLQGPLLPHPCLLSSPSSWVHTPMTPQRPGAAPHCPSHVPRVTRAPHSRWGAP
jgi:hypothetical protein